MKFLYRAEFTIALFFSFLLITRSFAEPVRLVGFHARDSTIPNKRFQSRTNESDNNLLVIKASRARFIKIYYQIAIKESSEARLQFRGG